MVNEADWCQSGRSNAVESCLVATLLSLSFSLKDDSVFDLRRVVRHFISEGDVNTKPLEMLLAIQCKSMGYSCTWLSMPYVLCMHEYSLPWFYCLFIIIIIIIIIVVIKPIYIISLSSGYQVPLKLSHLLQWFPKFILWNGGFPHVRLWTLL